MSKNKEIPLDGEIVQWDKVDTAKENKVLTKKAVSENPLKTAESISDGAEAETIIQSNDGSKDSPFKEVDPVSENLPLKLAKKAIKRFSKLIINIVADLASSFVTIIKSKKDKIADDKTVDGGVTDKKDTAASVETMNNVQTGIEFWNDAKKHVFSANPVFVKFIAVVPILGAAISLKNGILLSAAMILTVVLLNIIMYPLNIYLPRGCRTVVAFVTAGIVITPVCMLANYLAPSVAALCGIYLPLLAVCALPMIEKKHYGVHFGIFKTALVALIDGLGFAFAAILFSVIREVVGNGTLYDRPLPGIAQFKFSFALLPAGAFLLLGLLVALFKKIYGVTEDDKEDEE